MERVLPVARPPPAARGDQPRDLLGIGRWLAREHPGIDEPGQWTRELAAAFVAAVDRRTIGGWARPGYGRFRGRAGAPIGASSKDRLLGAARRSFRDLQEWGLIERRFDPSRALATPRSIRARIGPDPRVLRDDVWARLLWAGLTLAAEDVVVAPAGVRRPPLYDPVEMVRAVALVWLFAGLRASEIRRLRVSCLRRQRTRAEDDAAEVCLLDVPVNKTSPAFTKPVAVALAEAVEAWEWVRPEQPPPLDAKTGEWVSVLFAYRGVAVGATYLNAWPIPLLCRKAGVPEQDARGPITSHRARSTIASQLACAKQPMGLFELQQWLGHRSPLSTMQYVKTSLVRETRAYADAGSFDRNVRMIDVLVNRGKLRGVEGAQGAGLYDDLGHGYCTYEFFAQCPHRMACARCPVYVPREADEVRILEAEGSLVRLRQDLQLTDEERLAVDGDLAALRALRGRHWDTPTPAGAPARDLEDARLRADAARYAHLDGLPLLT